MSVTNEAAFPIPGTEDRNGNVTYSEFGLTKREYFAVHSTQPGCSEVCAVAGVEWNGSMVVLSGEHPTTMSFNKWWETLPLSRRLELFASVRVIQADALIAELNKVTP